MSDLRFPVVTTPKGGQPGMRMRGELSFILEASNGAVGTEIETWAPEPSPIILHCAGTSLSPLALSSLLYSLVNALVNFR